MFQKSNTIEKKGDTMKPKDKAIQYLMGLPTSNARFDLEPDIEKAIDIAVDETVEAGLRSRKATSEVQRRLINELKHRIEVLSREKQRMDLIIRRLNKELKDKGCK